MAEEPPTGEYEMVTEHMRATKRIEELRAAGRDAEADEIQRELWKVELARAELKARRSQ